MKKVTTNTRTIKTILTVLFILCSAASFAQTNEPQTLYQESRSFMILAAFFCVLGSILYLLDLFVDLPTFKVNGVPVSWIEDITGPTCILCALLLLYLLFS